MSLLARGIAVLTAAVASILAVQALVKGIYSRRRYVPAGSWRGRR